MRPDLEPAAVLDASAVLAYLQREPGFEIAGAALASSASISTVNLAEVYAKIVAGGIQLDPVAERLAALGLTPLAFTEQDAHTSALLLEKTRSLGLSLGDRACLALGARLGVHVLTTDHAWTRVAVDVDVNVIR